MKKILFVIIALYSYQDAAAQGCVAIRSTGNSCSLGKPGEAKGWQLNLNNRYFKSYKHFVGTVEQKHRVDSSTEVINHSWSLDISATHILNNRWSVSLTVPLISNKRSSKYEHYGNASKNPLARRTTRSFGIGDTRITLYRWLMDPAKSHKGNIQAGIGIKLPTGDFRYQDLFHRNDSTYAVAPVDQSIQLGDGGTGITAELKGFYNFSPRFGAYADLYYLVNPREQNGVSTARGGNTSANAIRYFTSTMSVPDQYMVRAGASYGTGKFSFSGGIRVEGIPSSDLVGGDKGFRRPGYVVSAEPVVSYMFKKAHVYASVPFALKRNRTQSYADKLQTAATGVRAQGDAAFSDYFISIGATFTFK